MQKKKRKRSNNARTQKSIEERENEGTLLPASTSESLSFSEKQDMDLKPFLKTNTEYSMPCLVIFVHS